MSGAAGVSFVPAGGARARQPLGAGLLVSALVHVSAIAALVFWAGTPEKAGPPVYRVELVGAPPGKRQAGVVDAASKPVAEKPATSGAERPVPAEKALPSKAQKTVNSPKATPSTQQTRESGSKSAVPDTKGASAPKAGAGSQGGKGADVANLRTAGIEFPYPGYLQNIVRQIALNWSPRRTSAMLVTEVKFMIRRDGSVAGIEIVKPSNDGLYNADAMGAVEAVGSTRGFGALPSGWKDDVLVVYFTFDYALRP